MIIEVDPGGGQGGERAALLARTRSGPAKAALTFASRPITSRPQ
jgi:hypothetical protein